MYKVKVRVIKPNRRIKTKRYSQRKALKLDNTVSIDGAEYIFDNERFIISRETKMGWPTYFQEYTFHENDPKPIFIHQNVKKNLVWIDATPEEIEEDSSEFVELEDVDGQIKTGYYIDGISAKELNKIFAPRFYDIVAKAGQNQYEKMTMYLSAGALVIGMYLVYDNMQLADRLVEALLKATGGG